MTQYVYNKQMPHGKCFVRYLRARFFGIRNLTRSISERQQLLLRVRSFHEVFYT